MKKILISFYFLLTGVAHEALSGTAYVKATGDNAAMAKNLAMANARQIVWNSVFPGIAAEPDEIADMVESSSIADEKNSGTEYSANVAISFSDNLVRKWAVENDVVLPRSLMVGAAGVAVSQVLFQISGLRQWTMLNSILRDNNIKMNVESIDGKNIIANVPAQNRAAFVNILRANGAEVMYEQ